MTTRRPISEKIMAVVGTYGAILTEMPFDSYDPRIQIAVLDAAVKLVLSSDTKDMGLIAPLSKSERFASDLMPKSNIDTLVALHANACRCPHKPWCDRHLTASSDPTDATCADHEHFDG